MTKTEGKLFDLTGKRALITGAAQGLGWAIAQAMAKQGAHVVLNGRNYQRLEQRAAELRTYAQAVDVFAQDITAKDCGLNFDLLCEQIGAPHILVNCVGLRLRQSLVESSEEQIASLIHSNLTALVLLSRHAALAMQVQGEGGRLIQLSSIAGRLAR